MKLGMYAVFDKKQRWYQFPFASQNQDDAKRAMTVRFTQNEVFPVMKQFPEDFDIYEVAVYETLEGVVEAYDKPIFVINCADIVKMEEE